MPTDNHSFEPQQRRFRQQLSVACLKYMNAHDLSREEMANILRISPSTLRTIIGGRANPSLNVISKIIAVTGYSINL